MFGTWNSCQISHSRADPVSLTLVQGPHCQFHSLLLSPAQCLCSPLTPVISSPLSQVCWKWLPFLFPPLISSFNALAPPSCSCHKDSASEVPSVWALFPRSPCGCLHISTQVLTPVFLLQEAFPGFTDWTSPHPNHYHHITLFYFIKVLFVSIIIFFI